MYKYLFSVMVIFVCIVLIQFQGCGLLDRMQKRRWERQQHREERFDQWRERREDQRDERRESWSNRDRNFQPFHRFRQR